MKIIIAHAYAGIGHKKAAEAVGEALAELGNSEAIVVDILDYTNRLFKFLYPRIYLFLINRLPSLWGFFYYLLDFKFVDLFFAPIRRFMHSIQAKEFIDFIIGKNPDVIICTHFLAAEVISDLKAKNRFHGKLVTVVTDFLPHSFWLARSSDYFIAAIQKTKKDLIRRGIEEQKIKVLGIPCQPKFSILRDRKELMKNFGLQGDFFNILMMSGGFGTGPIKKLVHSIASLGPEIKNNLQLIVICGKNINLFKELNNEKVNLGIRLHIFGYMNNVDEFMEMSDCIITKSGGLTISEALSKKLPMIIISPIPGQETRNCKVLTGYGVARRANNERQVIKYIREFIDLPEKIIGMKARINLLSYPNAAKEIADFAMHL